MNIDWFPEEPISDEEWEERVRDDIANADTRNDELWLKKMMDEEEQKNKEK